METNGDSVIEVPVRDDATEFGGRQRASLTLDSLGQVGIDVQGLRVADLGAGFGSLSIACAERGAEVIAADIHPDRVAAIEARAAAAGQPVTGRVADLLNTDFAGTDADLAFLIGVVEYAGLWDLQSEPRKLQQRVFETALGSLRSGGRLVFASKNRAWPRFIYRDANTGQAFVNALPRPLADRLSMRKSGEPYRHHIHTPRGWSRIIEAAGFVNVRRFTPYLSYQFPLRIVAKPSPRDLATLRRLEIPDDLRAVAWGRTGGAKAAVTALSGPVRLPLSHSTLIVAEKA